MLGGGGWGHHHHHHHRGGGFVYGTGLYYGGGRRGNGWVWGGIGFTIIVIVILSVALSIKFVGEPNEEKQYTPGDTRIIPFSTFFCSGLTVSSPELAFDAHLYLLTNEPPPLSFHHTIQFNDSFSLIEGQYQYWHFYMHANSNFSLEGCVTNSQDSYTFYIIKGTSNFHSWTDNPSSAKAVSSKYITKQCQFGKTSLTYSIAHDDHYYFAYYNDDNYYPVKGQQSLTLHRSEYDIPDASLVKYNCSFTSSTKCTFAVGFFSPFDKVLLTLQIPSNVDWSNAQYQIDIDCNSQALGYVIITVVPFIFVVILLAIVVGVVIWYRKQKTKTYQPLNYGKVDDPPPPYNPKYESI